MAGFRSGRGRGSRGAQQQRQEPGARQGREPGRSGPPQGRPGGYGTPGGNGGNGGGPGYGYPGPGPSGHAQQWASQGGHGEPEYFGGRPNRGQDPYANNPGHTQAFSVGDPYAQGGAPGAGQHGEWNAHGTYGGGGAPVPAGPRLHWKDLLTGVVFRPKDTYLRMRDHSMWGPALIVTFLYGLLAVFGLESTREEVLNSTFGTAAQYVVGTGVAMVIMGVTLGAVTHTLARQFGGEGSAAPTIGLSMLIMSLTDAPRSVVAAFLGAEAPAVVILGWLTWLAAGALLTMMVGRSHELPWQKALGAGAVQLLALLFLIKLGTL